MLVATFFKSPEAPQQQELTPANLAMNLATSSNPKQAFIQFYMDYLARVYTELEKYNITKELIDLHTVSLMKVVDQLIKCGKKLIESDVARSQLSSLHINGDKLIKQARDYIAGCKKGENEPTTFGMLSALAESFNGASCIFARFFVIEYTKIPNKREKEVWDKLCCDINDLTTDIFGYFCDNKEVPSCLVENRDYVSELFKQICFYTDGREINLSDYFEKAYLKLGGKNTASTTIDSNESQDPYFNSLSSFGNHFFLCYNLKSKLDT
ncbi:hypothetical protein H4219_005435 [Mycoemilia scoparia]|uniref:Uncharacterized protein n=1 Tax=Mycoemilia scoparia TaxID=417184 RepID=A0A9W7ZMY7_9FUNG|nr:hypothetical protein H4219_005435 [Mycoemilia scoparia]